MRNDQQQFPLVTLPDYSTDDVKQKRNELAQPKLNAFHHWFRTQFIVYFCVLFGLIAYLAPYALHFLMRDYSLVYWSNAVSSYAPVWILVATMLAMLTAPHKLFQLRPSMKEAECVLRQEKCAAQMQVASYSVKRQINAYCLAVYKR